MSTVYLFCCVSYFCLPLSIEYIFPNGSFDLIVPRSVPLGNP